MRSMATSLTAAMLLVLPGTAEACTIPFRHLKALYLARTDLKSPAKKTTPAKMWKMDSTKWLPLEPQLNQIVTVRDRHSYWSVTFGDQRTLSIDAKGTYGTDHVYEQDPDSFTQCQAVGQRQWTDPIIRKIETTREVRILAATRPNPVDANGCVLSQDATECPQLTRKLINLSRPMGTRKLIFADFESTLDDEYDEYEDEAGYPNYG